ncbi:MAG: type II toxin-antitoxin system Phd/YefM family antitoxin [Planctomycetota bacterium]
MASTRKSPAIVYEDGEPTAVIVDIDDYQELLERAEDADDLQALQEMRRRPLQFRKLSDFLAEHEHGV